MAYFYQKLFILVLSCVYGISHSSHQRWWKRPNCNCSAQERSESPPTGNTVSEVIKSMFPGLLLNSNDLKKLSVMKPEGTRRQGETSYVGKTPHLGTVVPNSCCQTEFTYEIINTTVSNNRNLKVVHFDNAFQFVPTGKCPENSTCGKGTCIQMYRHQWLLIWDDTLPHYPPVTFAAVEVASHCECVNVGS